MINQSINTFSRIIIVSNRLPFKIVNTNGENKLTQNSGGLVSAILSLSEKKNEYINDSSGKIIWIGSSDHTREEFKEVASQNNDFDIYPVQIDKQIYEKYYEGFCNDTLWPLFHYFTSYAIYDDSYYENYTIANQLFFNELEKIIQPNDFVWVHDYQLCLLPNLIRNTFPDAIIGFFLHIPFPSYEIFRLLRRKWREEILNGILGADLVGFHIYDYTQHFLQSVRRLLGYETTLRYINTEDRIIKVETFPIGINFEKFENASKSLDIQNEIQKLQNILGEKKLIFSVDRLDYTKGILDKLEGVKYFLKTYPEWHQKIIFNMVVVPSRDTIPRYSNMKKEIEAIVGQINGKYSTFDWRPIVYQYKSLQFNEMIALYSYSHIGLITPLRDGMNLVAKEYIASQEHNQGVLIISELAGAVAELGEAIIINPTDSKEVGDAINRALGMDEEEIESKNKKMKIRLKNYDVFTWTNDFIEQLYLVKKDLKGMKVKLLNINIEKNLINDYKLADKRLILFDYDGTLVSFSKYPENAIPSNDLLGKLNTLSNDSKNDIVIVSGRDRNFLDKHFRNLNLILIAEHGAFYKFPHKDWEGHIEMDDKWKSKIRDILDRYTKRCNGSLIEEKEVSLAWHYRNSDTEFTGVRYQELKEELFEFLNYDHTLQILEGNKVIEIKKTGYDKGTIIQKLFLDSGRFNFIMAIGDDKTDEDLFKVLPEDSYTIKVGMTVSKAKYNLKAQSAVIDLIQKIESI
jgi:trehalose 6-phosphate synthase/phosphatase